MTYKIFSTLLLLTLAGSEAVAVDKDSTKPHCYNTAPNRAVCTLPDLPPYEPPDPCLTQMEAAMRAMAPHLGEGLTMFWRTPEEGKRHAEKMRIKQQWDDAAKACWRDNK